MSQVDFEDDIPTPINPPRVTTLVVQNQTTTPNNQCRYETYMLDP